MSNRYRLKKAINKFSDVKESIIEEVPAKLGVQKGGVKLTEVPGRPGYVWVRIRGDLSELTQAYNDQVSLVYDLPVILERDRIDKGRWRVKGRDLGIYQHWGSSSYLPRHGAQHSFDPDSKGADIVWVFGKQFMPLLVYPSGSNGAPNALIEEGIFYNSGEWKYAGNTGTADIAPTNNPTGSSNARMVLVWLDIDGNPQLEPGDLEFSSSITGNAGIVPYLPALPSAYGVPLAGVRLVTGTSRILWDNLYDLRPHIVGDGFIPTGTSGGTVTIGPNQIAFSNSSGTVIGWDYLSTRGPQAGQINLRIGANTAGPQSRNNDYNIANVTQPNSASGSADLTYAGFGYGATPKVDFFRANNEEISPTLVNDDDEIGVLQFYGYISGSSAGPFSRPYWTTIGLLKLTAEQAFSNDSLWSKWTFRNTPSGSVSPVDTLWIMDDVVGIPLDAGYHWGDAATTGTWRSVIRNNRVEFQKNVSGSWVTLGFSNTGSAAGSLALDDLTDVVITSPQVDQVIQYDGANWVNTDLSVSGTYPPSWKFDIDEPPTSPGTPNDEFSAGTLDVKWTLVSGSAGTVSMISTDTTPIYDLASRSGWLLVQVGANREFEIRQDYTLPSGSSIVLSLAPNLLADNNIANDELLIGLALNDSDTNYDANNYVFMTLDPNAGGVRWAYFRTGGTLVGSTLDGNPIAEVPGQHYVRILRAGDVYYGYMSHDGITWMPLGSYTPAAILDNIWIVVHSKASFSTPNPIQAFGWIREGGSGIDPW